MLQPFDIFKVEEDGKVFWLDAAPSLQAATARIQALLADRRDRFLILNQDTGNRLFVPPVSARDHTKLK